MNITNTITFTLDLQYCNINLKLRPSILSKILTAMILPEEFTQEIWVPNSMGDCVWFWIEFTTLENKNNYIEKLNNIFSSRFLNEIIATNITQETLNRFVGDDKSKFISFDYLSGFKTSRNANGIKL
jgi:hypothetical protein